MDDYYDGSGYDRETVRFFDVAHEGAQVRAVAGSIDRLVGVRELQPRSLVILARDMLAEASARFVTAVRTPLRLPVVVTTSLPTYVGALDLVVGIGDRGDDPELARDLLSANRRGAVTVLIGPAQGPITEDISPDTIRVTPLPTSVGSSPARAICAVSTVLDLLEEDEQLVAQRLAVIADELDEDATQLSPERDILVNPARRLRTFIDGSRLLHTGVGPVAEAAAELIAAIFTAKGLSSGWASAAELGDALGDPAPVDDLFHDPFLDGPSSLVALKTIVWGTYATDIAHAQAVECPPSAAGPTGQALRMITRAFAVTALDADADGGL
ncbi:hypothetical protein [Corynebacterium guangdongense]|uniref:Exopolyphosphatase n=1 Tax=Corynebacterium guangdongense TaxID=1783348 RepID=A0ABU1ZUT2_9CORY|nr:hypothetical protein [Corynebacterium guangdongense]MDR7328691.1 hypothetical protein [Corynebacterium guangdongense]